MEVIDGQCKGKPLNTNNKKNKFNIGVSVTEKLYGYLRIKKYYVKLHLYAILRSDPSSPPKEIRFTVWDNLDNCMELTNSFLEFRINKIEKEKYSKIGSYSNYQFYFVANLHDQNSGLLVHTMDGNSKFSIID